MIAWLWDAPGSGGRSGHGISDDPAAAIHAAEACLLSGHAHAARVEQALAVLETETLTSCYQRTGRGWQAQRGATGAITWEPLAREPTAQATTGSSREVSSAGVPCVR